MRGCSGPAWHDGTGAPGAHAVTLESRTPLPLTVPHSSCPASYPRRPGPSVDTCGQTWKRLPRAVQGQQGTHGAQGRGERRVPRSGREESARGALWRVARPVLLPAFGEPSRVYLYLNKSKHMFKAALSQSAADANGSLRLLAPRACSSTHEHPAACEPCSLRASLSTLLNVLVWCSSSRGRGHRQACTPALSTRHTPHATQHTAHSTQHPGGSRQPGNENREATRSSTRVTVMPPYTHLRGRRGTGSVGDGVGEGLRLKCE